MAELALEDDSVWYEETGDGQPLVFVHGAWMDGNVWRDQVDRFAEDHRVVTVDLRGHGRTGPTDRRRYSVGLFVDDLEEVLEHVGIERPILCGLSLGGIVVQAYLDRHPAKAAGAVVAGPARSMPPVELPRTLKPFVSPLAGLAGSLSVAGTETTFRSMLRSIRAATGEPWLSVDPSTRERAVADVGDMPPDEYRKIFGALYYVAPPDLSGVPTPTHVIYGERESALVKRQARQIARSVEDGRWTEIPGAAHLVNVDNPSRFNDALSAFVEDVAR